MLNSRKFKKGLRKNIKGYLFISPWLVGFSVFSLYAIGSAIYYSFCKYSVFKPPQWIGLVNYRTIFTDDPLFSKSLYNTAYYSILAILLGITVAFLLAILLNQKVRGLSVFRAIFYIPSITPIVASSVLWLWVLNQYGLLNIFLNYLGIKGPAWLTNPAWSKFSLVLMSVWASGGTMIIFLAGLQGVPQQLYEAAELDGAGIWHKFRHVTIPIMTPVIFFNLIMGIIGSFQVFVQAFIMTEGGPADSTLFYVLYLYHNAFSYYKMGYAAALAIILFVIILSLSLIIFSTSKKWVHYGTGR
ncbi:MAG: ABC transporter permease subunit [Clostridia bacterium]|nr:ABC transporter permease subunit [Clostridia bacterium]